MNEEILTDSAAKELDLVVLPIEAAQKNVTIISKCEDVVTVTKNEGSATTYNFTAVHPGETEVITRATDESLVTNKLTVKVESPQSISARFSGDEALIYYRDIPSTERPYFETYSFYGDDREYKTVYYQLGKVYKFEEISHTFYETDPDISDLVKWMQNTFGSNFGELISIPDPDADDFKKIIWVKKNEPSSKVILLDRIQSLFERERLLYCGSNVRFVLTKSMLKVTGSKCTKIGEGYKED